MIDLATGVLDFSGYNINKNINNFIFFICLTGFCFFLIFNPNLTLIEGVLRDELSLCGLREFSSFLACFEF